MSHLNSQSPYKCSEQLLLLLFSLFCFIGGPRRDEIIHSIRSFDSKSSPFRKNVLRNYKEAEIILVNEMTYIHTKYKDTIPSINKHTI